LPLAFLSGYVLTRLQEASLSNTIVLLRGDWEAAKGKVLNLA
jgi:hypothetical protein